MQQLEKTCLTRNNNNINGSTATATFTTTSAKSSSKSSASNTIPWTPARCNRLLRPLKTRLDAIRKHVNFQAATRTCRAGPPEAEKAEDRHSRNGTNAAIFLRTPARSAPVNPPAAMLLMSSTSKERRDPDWVPVPAGRRNRGKKYSVRGTKKEDVKPAVLPGEISVPSPLLSRKQVASTTLSYAGSSFPVPLFVEEEAAEHIGEASVVQHGGRKSKRLWIWPKCHVLLQTDMGSKTSEQMKLFNSLLEAVENMLRATSPLSSHPDSTVSAPSPTSGPRSLFATCLRQMPRYIALEDFFRRQDNPDYKDDTASDMFELLESMSSAPGQGWVSLREVVRAQAVSMLLEVVSEGIFTLDMIKALASLSAQLGAITEAQDIVSTYLAGLGFASIENSDEYDATRAKDWPLVKMFGQIDCAMTKDVEHSFTMRTLDTMLLRGRLDIQTVATRQMGHIWSHFVVPAVMQPRFVSAEAARFITTTVRLACGLDKAFLPSEPRNQQLDMLKAVEQYSQDALSNTVSSLLSILASTVLTSHKSSLELEDRESSAMLSLDIIASLTLDVAVVYDNDDRSHQTKIRNTHVQACRSATIIMTMILLRAICTPDTFSDQFTTIDACVHLLERIASSTANSLQPASRLLDHLPSFILGIVACCARLHQSTSADSDVKAFVNKLLFRDFNSSQISAGSVSVLRRIALDTTLQYSRAAVTKADVRVRRKLVDEAEFFIEMHPLSCSNLSLLLQKNFGGGKKVGLQDVEQEAANPGEGYRWEPGLAEWIAATPLKHLGKANFGAQKAPLSREEEFSDEVEDLLSPNQSAEVLTSPLGGMGVDEFHTRSSPSCSPSPEDSKLNSIFYQPLSRMSAKRHDSPTIYEDDLEPTRRRKRMRYLTSRLLADVTNIRKDAESPVPASNAEFYTIANRVTLKWSRNAEHAGLPKPTENVGASRHRRVAAGDEDELAGMETSVKRPARRPVAKLAMQKARNSMAATRREDVEEEDEDELSFGF